MVDPVAFCFDAKCDLYVVEMRGYPNGGVGEGPPNLPGRVKKLEDKDGDGYFETATVFLDNLRFPCAITPWRNGFLIGDAPDLFFAADTDGDGKADVRKVLYTGFGTKNIQQMINSLQFHFDNWVYGCNGGNDSPVRSVEKPDVPVVQLRGMHFRLQARRAGEPGSRLRRRAVWADGHRVGRLADVHQQPAHPPHRVAGPLPEAQPAPGGAGRHARHCRPRGGVQGVSHQPVRAVAGRADDPASGQRGRQAVSRRPSWCRAVT